mmetsp:Transcript_61/g.114  ORF Transcript_61/g.114 Transcript_61/m.114 type:complete len:444 (-) Transcript_61:161-1492(-)
MTSTNTIVVGGGHAGVNLACMLAIDEPSVDYLVLERDDSLLVKWRKYRWEKFNLNTPIKYSLLYGQQDERDEWLLDRSIEGELERWDAHIAKLGIRHKLHSNVKNIEKDDEKDAFIVTVEESDPSNGTKSIVKYQSTNVVVCNGYYDKPTSPLPIANGIASARCGIKQHIAAANFQFNDLVDGSALLVGSGQTGIQVADLLLRYKPEVKLYLCTSTVKGCPRSFDSKDVFYWLEEMGILTMPRSAVEAIKETDPKKYESLRYPKAPVHGQTADVSPFSLHRRGVELMGHLDSVVHNEGDDDVTFVFKDDRAENLQCCYNGFLGISTAIKKHANSSLDSPNPPEWSNVELELLKESGRLVLSAKDENITNVIFCTGWSHDFAFLRGIKGIEGDLDKKIQAPDVITSRVIKGLFYCGFPTIGTLQSLNIVKFNLDTKVILDGIRK